jgi:hypothetical protein
MRSSVPAPAGAASRYELSAFAQQLVAFPERSRAGRDPTEKCGLMALLLFGGLAVLAVVLWISTGRPRTWLTVRRHRRRRYR